MKIEETKEYQRSVEISNRLHGLKRDLLDFSEELRYWHCELSLQRDIAKLEYLQHYLADTIIRNCVALSKLIKGE